MKLRTKLIYCLIASALSGPVFSGALNNTPASNVRGGEKTSPYNTTERERSPESDVWISEVEFTNAQMYDVIRTLSELSNSNIIATPSAANRELTIHLKDITILDAVKSISRISDLWYRYDEDTNTYRLMTREEYSQDLIVRESENIEIFRLLNANVLVIAQAIEDLFGSRVRLSYGLPPASNANSGGAGGTSGRSGVGSVRGGNSSVRNSRSFGGGIGGGRGTSSRGGSNMLEQSGSQLEAADLTVDQIEQLAQALEISGSRNVSQEALQQATVQSQPIFVTVNNEHNMIIVRSDDKSVLTGIRKLIDEMDIPVPQVMLEMRILNVILGEDFNSIFNFEIERKDNGEFINSNILGNNSISNAGTFVYEILNGRLRANIEFLEENNRIRVLSNPMVVASNHRPAELFIGEETLLTQGFTFFPALTNAAGNTIQPSYVQADVTREDIGITLRITPRINGDNTVELDIEQENSLVNPGGGVIPVGDGQGNVRNLPVDTVDTARLTGTVMAKDSLTVAVGGLIRTSKNRSERKVPILSEIPVLGRVFTSSIESEQDTETVLLITPRIMNVPSDSENIRASKNQFYQNFNRDFPEPQPFDNRFINKDQDAENSQYIPDFNESAQFSELTNYAAQMVRTPNLQRPDSKQYKLLKVIPIAAGLFDNPAIKTVPMNSWQKGSLYITAVQLFNRSDKPQDIDASQVKGRWLAKAIEDDRLDSNGQQQSVSMLYLVSDKPFEDMLPLLN